MASTKLHPAFAAAAGLLGICAIALATACGPAIEFEPVAEEDTDEPAGNSTGASSDAEVSTTASPEEEATGSSTGGLEDGGTEDESDASDGFDESDGDEGPYDDECGCDESVTVGVDDAFGGHSAASILASLQTPEIDWEWLEFADSPTHTTLQLGIEYADGPVMHGPEGSNGCGFLSAPCPNALLIPVVLTVTTADGWISTSIPATIDVDLDRYALSVSLAAPAEAAELGGTFAEQAVPGLEGSPTAIGWTFSWGLDGSWVDAHLAGNTPEGYGLLGRAL